MSNPSSCKTQLYKRHVLADSGINLTHQQTIAVERFAALDFHRSLPNSRFAVGGGLDIVHKSCEPSNDQVHAFYARRLGFRKPLCNECPRVPLDMTKPPH